MLTLSRQHARRIAIRAQLLDAYRPESLLATVDHLTAIQIDPTNAIAPNVDLVAWSRLGSDYSPSDVKFALEHERSLVEHNSFVRPMDDIGLMLATVDDWPRRRDAEVWMTANAAFRTDVLAALAADGPLVAGAIADTASVPWASSGWTNDRNVVQMLEFLTRFGDVAVSGREGRNRLWDLAERVYPADLVVPSRDAALAELTGRRLTALGITRPQAVRTALEPTPIEFANGGSNAVEVEVDGVPGTWIIDPEALAADAADFRGRAALLSPFDRLVYDRERALDLFEFEYVLEMYKPAANRRWGYFALPILHGDQLVGKLDAKTDRKAGLLRVHTIHDDVGFTEEMTDAIETEVVALADWLGLELDR
ncbi:MAG TPA: crosslink repair DNA glycosylase YcaQ family protein [Ilumatobacter sp.]|nr:crosslink repair DNA glycosylase YcaQ family protein [Ilumatobacter sp.]